MGYRNELSFIIHCVYEESGRYSEFVVSTCEQHCMYMSYVIAVTSAQIISHEVDFALSCG